MITHYFVDSDAFMILIQSEGIEYISSAGRRVVSEADAYVLRDILVKTDKSETNTVR